MSEHDLHVPVTHFTSKAHLADELVALRRLPLVVGHRSELPQPGDFITREILGTPLIIVRRGDGQIASYLNMCRHRGGTCGVGVEGVDAGICMQVSRLELRPG